MSRQHPGDDSLPQAKGIEKFARRTSLGVQPRNATAGHTRRVQSIDATPKRYTQPRSLGASLLTDSVREQSPPKLPTIIAGVFSDEYDLYPQILRDVERAVKLAERRANKAHLLSAPTSDGLRPDATSGSSLAGSSSPRSRQTDLQAPFPVMANDDTNTLAEREVHALNVVPLSIDQGKTLDWSSTTLLEERSERKWALSVTKRKGKEKAHAHSAIDLQEIELDYTKKLKRIRAAAGPETLRRAGIAEDQLGRRYALLRKHPGWNLAEVSRWYGTRGPAAQLVLETTDPFDWLEYIASGPSKTNLNRRYLSAVITEEFSKREHPSKAVLEPVNGNPAPVLMTPSKRVSSFFANGTISSRKSTEQSPLSDYIRPSFENTHSYSKSLSAYSPSRHDRLTVYRRTARRRDNDSDNELSSARNSFSERSDDGKYGSRHQSPTRAFVRARTLPESNITTTLPVGPRDDASSLGDASSIEPPRSVAERSLRDTSSVRNRYSRKVRISLPATDQNSAEPGRKRRQAVEEEQEKEEYAAKQRLLETVTNQNIRVRQLLNRVSISIREYETIQLSLMTSLGVPYKRLPPELIAAFSYDPSVITGVTKKYQGWKAVDEIHSRLIRQRKAFRDYLADASNISAVSSAKSLLSEPISTLMCCLSALETHRRDIVSRGENVANLLTQVKNIHGPAKREYNEALSHTSVAYPELSNIIALEDSYKDQYQQFWEIGMGALTFILDNVTPFWRTYGKTIGDDIQDFIIIPLYRHEFTGAPKKYPITVFPRRSFRHLVCLALFLFGTIAVTFLQTRAAISSVVYSRLTWISQSGIRWTVIPFFWVGIVIQWCAVLIETIIVLMQLMTIIWWLGWAVKIFT